MPGGPGNGSPGHAGYADMLCHQLHASWLVLDSLVTPSLCTQRTAWALMPWAAACSYGLLPQALGWAQRGRPQGELRPSSHFPAATPQTKAPARCQPHGMGTSSPTLSVQALLLPSTPPLPGPASPNKHPIPGGGAGQDPCPSPAGPQPGLLSPGPTRDHQPYMDPCTPSPGPLHGPSAQGSSRGCISCPGCRPGLLRPGLPQ